MGNVYILESVPVERSFDGGLISVTLTTRTGLAGLKSFKDS